VLDVSWKFVGSAYVFSSIHTSYFFAYIMCVFVFYASNI
jgi:hypothetical protein